jgi:uncharacterized coiled-coil protein SlyX
MTDNATQTLLLKATVDEIAATKGVEALRRIETQNDAVRDSFKRIGAEADSSMGHLQRFVDDMNSKVIASIGGFNAETNEATKNLRILIDEMGNVKSGGLDFGPLPDTGGGGGGIGGVTGLRRTGSALSQLGLGEVGRPVSLAGDVQQVINELNQVGDAFKGLPGVMGKVATEGSALGGSFLGILDVLGPLALVGVPVALAFKQVFDIVHEGQETVESANKAMDLYFKTIQNGTTATINQQIAVQQAIIDKNKPQIGTLQDKQTAINNQDTGEAANINSVIFGLLEGKNLEDLKNQNKQAQDAIDALNRALHSNEVAANDAAKAYLDHQHAMRQSSQEIKSQIQALEEDRNANLIRIAYLQHNGDASDETNKKIQALSKQMDADSQAADDLKKNILPLVEAREREAQLVKDSEKALNDYENALKQAAQIGDHIAQEELDRAKKLGREKEKDDIDAARKATELDYQQRIDAAKRDEEANAARDKLRQDDADAETKHDADVNKVDQEGMQRELKAYADYYAAEKNQTDRANLQRLHTLESAQMDLKSLAARGDVAAALDQLHPADRDASHPGRRRGL